MPHFRYLLWDINLLKFAYFCFISEPSRKPAQWWGFPHSQGGIWWVSLYASTFTYTTHLHSHYQQQLTLIIFIYLFYLIGVLCCTPEHFRYMTVSRIMAGGNQAVPRENCWKTFILTMWQTSHYLPWQVTVLTMRKSSHAFKGKSEQWEKRTINPILTLFLCIV